MMKKRILSISLSLFLLFSSITAFANEAWGEDAEYIAVFLSLLDEGTSYRFLQLDSQFEGEFLAHLFGVLENMEEVYIIAETMNAMPPLEVAWLTDTLLMQFLLDTGRMEDPLADFDFTQIPSVGEIEFFLSNVIWEYLVDFDFDLIDFLEQNNISEEDFIDILFLIIQLEGLETLVLRWGPVWPYNMIEEFVFQLHFQDAQSFEMLHAWNASRVLFDLIGQEMYEALFNSHFIYHLYSILGLEQVAGFFQSPLIEYLLADNRRMVAIASFFIDAVELEQVEDIIGIEFLQYMPLYPGYLRMDYILAMIETNLDRILETLDGIEVNLDIFSAWHRLYDYEQSHVVYVELSPELIEERIAFNLDQYLEGSILHILQGAEYARLNVFFRNDHETESLFLFLNLRGEDRIYSIRAVELAPGGHFVEQLAQDIHRGLDIDVHMITSGDIIPWPLRGEFAVRKTNQDLE